MSKSKLFKKSRLEKRIFKFIKNAHKQAANTPRKKKKKKRLNG